MGPLECETELAFIRPSAAACISASTACRQTRRELKAGPVWSINKLDFYGFGFLIQLGVYNEFYVLLG
jgi:hypothetical protein